MNKSVKCGALSIAAVLLGLGIWRLGHPVSIWYVSASLDTQGRRAKMQVPYGWQIDARSSHLPAGIVGTGERVTIIFVSQEPMLSRWLRWVRKQPPPPSARLYLDIGWNLESLGMNPAAPADGKEDVGGCPPFTAPYLSYRIIKADQPRIYGVAACDSEDKLTFDRTHTLINTFRIE